MAYSTISKPSLYFNTKIYTGNASTQAITGVGFQPDWLWIKNRSTTNAHNIFDAVRGTNKKLDSSEATAENTSATNLTSFDSDGFTLASNAGTNGSGNNLVSWNWKAGSGAGSSNTDGSINTTSTSVNTTAGFSISTYTGTGSNATVGHGLGVAPAWIIIKSLSNAKDWTIYHSALGNTKWLELNSNGAEQTNSNRWNDTSPTSSVFTVNVDSSVNGSGYTYVAYCFAEKTGYSKFGKYTANASTNGTFIYTGFKPAFLMVKRTNQAAPWSMIDAGRNTHNPANLELQADTNSAEASQGDGCDFLSNGVKLRDSADMNSGSGDTFIYMAFAEEPLVANVGSGVPATAR